MKRRYIYALSTFLIWGAVGCNKPTDFGDANLDPSAVNTYLPAAVLTNAEVAAAGFASTGTEAISGAQYGQYFSETQYSTASLYAIPQNSFTGNYTGVLYDLQSIIDKGTDKNAKAVAKILQQYIFWVITDSWGDVPYSQALKGVTAITPVYDKQEDIYKGILATLASAQSELDANAAIPGDIIYGNSGQWKLAANSLRMLVSIQLSKKVPSASGYAATDFKAALAAGYIDANSENMDIAYPGGSYKSRWWSVYDGRKDFAESKTMTDLLGSLGDARIAPYGGASEAAGNVTTSNVGVPYGLKRDNVLIFTDANANWARVLRGDLRLETGTVTIISAAESKLAIAEAQNIGWVAPGGSYYTDGITLAHQQYGVTASASYLTSANVALSPTGTTAADLAKITIQRWIASYPDGHMAWNIWRKSTPASTVPASPTVAYGSPALTPAPDAVNTSKQIVRRFTYAAAEFTTNGPNVNEAISRIPGGKDSQDARVWWDQN